MFLPSLLMVAHAYIIPSALERQCLVQLIDRQSPPITSYMEADVPALQQELSCKHIIMS